MRPLALLLAACLALACAGAARAADAAAAARSRLDPRLAAATAPGAAPVAVWVEFVDKGEQGPADLAARLAQAERDLTPENRRRREKAHVQPLVDYLDLPLEPRYVLELVAAGFQPYGQSRWFNRVAVHTSGPALLALAARSFVRRVAPVELAEPRPHLPPAVPEPPGAVRAPSLPTAAQVLYGRTLGQLSRLNVPAVHDSGYIGSRVNVCMLDDGFNWYRKHEALRHIHIGGGSRDFIRGVYSVQDTLDAAALFEHGTWTLGALAGNAPGIYIGPGYDANLMLGRTEDSGSETPIEMVYWSMGAEWADSLGSDIISSSLGYNLFQPPGPSLTYQQLDGHTSVVTRAAEIAAAKGMLVVVSAGNDGQNRSVGYKVGAPADANGDSVLAIGAVDSLGVRALFSSKGPTVDGRIKPDLAAQGVAVLLPDNSGFDPNGYERQSGTSFAAPLVAGLAACLIQARPNWTPVQVIQALKHSASQATHPDTLLGWGIPDGLAALRYVPDTTHAPEQHGPLSLRLAGPNPLRVAGPPVALRVVLGVEAPPASFRVRVFDAGGRLVRQLAAGALAPGGTFDLSWRGDDARGRALVPGLYFVSLEGAGRQDVVRVVVLR